MKFRGLTKSLSKKNTYGRLHALCMVCAVVTSACEDDQSTTPSTVPSTGSTVDTGETANADSAATADGNGTSMAMPSTPNTAGAVPNSADSATDGQTGAPITVPLDPGSNAVPPAMGGVEDAPAAADPLPSAATDPRTPPEVGRSWKQWPLPGKDYNNSRYTQDSHISTANVSELKEAWRVDLNGLVIAYGLVSTVPIIVDDTVYIEDLSSSVRAIDLATGTVKWTVQEANLNPGPNGVAVGWGKVFGIRGSDTVVAYDAETGAEIWAQNVVDTATAGIDIQPTVFDGQVLVSTVPISTRGIYVGGDRGILKALDQETGDERWRFDTIATPEDVWGNDTVNSGGGAWYPPSIDVDAGQVFWAVANPAPFPGTPEYPNGSSRPGDNLYTDSTLVLDAADGSYQWHHQTIQGDLFDRDLLHTMLTEVDGVPIVVSTGKEGRLWANRRDNGEVLWGPVSIGMHMNDDLTELSSAGTTQVLPGSFGGVLTPPALAEGVAYAVTLNAPTTYRSNRTAYFGSEIGTMSGSLAAVDVASGERLWEVAVDGDPTGGVTVINDLVITATFQGTLYAFDRKSGEEVWRWKAPGGINSWLSVAGDTLIVPVGSANPATVVALRLGADAAAAADATGQAAGTDADSTTTDGASFSSIYSEILAPRCAGPLCHGSAMTGGSLLIETGTDKSALHGALVGQPASGSECASSGLSMVVPGDPSMSLLYTKLAGTPPCGTRMPPTGALSAEDLERIRQWIAGGAEDN